MQKFWSILFGATMFAALLLFIISPFVSGWWLPKDISTFGGGIDRLFYLILAITGFFFILTEADIQKVCAHNYTAWMDSIGWKRPRNPASFDCRWSISDIRQFEDKWELIMDRLRMAAPDKSLASVS